MKTLSILAAVMALTVASGAQAGPAELAQAKNCLACHGIDHKVVGPAYKAVAAKYRGNKGAETTLVAKVLKGGAGVWGPVPMPANSGLSDAEAHTLVKWVLAQ